MRLPGLGALCALTRGNPVAVERRAPGGDDDAPGAALRLASASGASLGAVAAREAAEEAAATVAAPRDVAAPLRRRGALRPREEQRLPVSRRSWRSGRLPSDAVRASGSRGRRAGRRARSARRTPSTRPRVASLSPRGPLARLPVTPPSGSSFPLIFPTSPRRGGEGGRPAGALPGLLPRSRDQAHACWPAPQWIEICPVRGCASRWLSTAAKHASSKGIGRATSRSGATPPALTPTTTGTGWPWSRRVNSLNASTAGLPCSMPRSRRRRGRRLAGLSELLYPALRRV
jgi:hypothetical protein